MSGHAANMREWLYGTPLSERAHRVIGIVLPALLACWQMSRVRTHTVDDAYISFRYARNFARGLGLVYNEGQRIEGYTNFLWTVLMGGVVKVGIEPVVAAKAIGAACSIGSLVLVYEISRRLLPYTLAPCIATWLLASTTVFQGYAVWGLETSMFACLLLAGTFLFMREESDDAPGVPFSGLAFAAAGLTRPEAPMYLGLLMLFMVGKPLLRLGKGEEDGDGIDMVEDRAVILFSCILTVAVMLSVQLSMKSRSTPMLIVAGIVTIVSLAVFVVSMPRTMFSRRNLLRAAIFIVPIALHIAWRHSYYGTWLPNTLTAKTGSLAQQVAGGAKYIFGFINHEGPVIYLALFGVAAGLVWRRLEMLALSAIVMCGGVYVVVVGGDWMALYRFCAPLQPFLFILIGVAARTLVEKKSRVANYGLLMFAMVTVALRSHAMSVDANVIINGDKRFWDAAAGGVADWFIERRAQHGDAVIGTIAMGDIGRIGYRTDFPVLDLLGLVDPTISKLPGGYTNKVGQGFKDHFFASKPRYFILISAEGDCKHPSVIGSIVLYNDKRFLAAYAESGAVELDAGFAWCIYEHIDYLDR
jgi:arabinofuranosyltransferase